MRHEYRTQAQQDAVQGTQRRCFPARSIKDQQLMLEKKRFGDDGAGTSRSHDLDDRDDQVSHQDEPIAHAANNGLRKSMTQPPTAAESQFAMDRQFPARHGDNGPVAFP